MLECFRHYLVDIECDEDPGVFLMVLKEKEV